jgi:predicted AAA+ superfamily ATPase
VGKTWLAKEIGKDFKKTTYLTYDRFEDREIIKTETWPNSTELLILDELHKMNGWKNYLKGIFDTKLTHLKILVTGSARLDSFRKTGDSLAGRFFTHHLMPFSMAEFKDIEEGKFIELPYDMIQVGYADGNISSNTADLFTWHKYIYMSDSELLLKRSLLKEAFKPHIFANGTPVKYGLGFFLGEIEDHSPAYNRLGEIWHTGGTEGFVSRCSRFTEADTTITMLTNYDGLDKEELFFPIADEVFREA